MENQKIFFSYSRQDASEFALRIYHDLNDRGVNVWIDQVDIEPGKRWDMEIEKALKECPYVVFIMSDVSVGSDHVLDEVYYAMSKGKHVIPILLNQCEIPYRLMRLQTIDFTKGYENGFENLSRVLKINSHTEKAKKVTDEPEIILEEQNEAVKAEEEKIKKLQAEYLKAEQEKVQLAKAKYLKEEEKSTKKRAVEQSSRTTPTPREIKGIYKFTDVFLYLTKADADTFKHRLGTLDINSHSIEFTGNDGFKKRVADILSIEYVKGTNGGENLVCIKNNEPGVAQGVCYFNQTSIFFDGPTLKMHNKLMELVSNGALRMANQVR